jgi:aspartate racemase
MKVLGLIGGTGWPSTRDYYELLNQAVQARKGGLSGVELRLWSFDFQQLLNQSGGEAGALSAAFTAAGKALVGCGAQVLALSSATGHLFAQQLTAIGTIFVSLPEVCAQELKLRGVKRVLVLGTKLAVEGGVFDTAFKAQSIEVIKPPAPLQAALDLAIFDELERAAPAEKCARAIQQLIDFCAIHSVEHVLLGCTELRPKLFAQSSIDAPLNLHDSTAIHVKQLIEILDTATSE